MHLYGTRSEQLAEIAVTMRRHAALNPAAKMRKEITVDDVLSSRVISDPLHLLDCCIISDGGGALVVTSLERARDLAKPPIQLRGSGEAVCHQEIGSPDMLSIAASQSSAEAFRMAGVSHDDIDVAMIYDSFTITVLLTLENLGFCKPGEGGELRRATGASAWAASCRSTPTAAAVLEPPRHARHLPGDRSRQAAARRVRCDRQVEGAEDGARARNRRHCSGSLHSGATLDAECETEEAMAKDISTPADPTPTGKPVAYWEGCGRVASWCLQRCGDVQGDVSAPAASTSVPPVSPTEIEHFVASGRGSIHSYTVTHQNQTPAFREAVPYVLAYVDLEEGVRILSNVVGCTPEEVKIGLPVRVEFTEPAEPAGEIAIPRFRPE